MIIFCISVVLFYEYNTNYNWRYRDFLQDITDIQGNEYIAKIEMSVPKKPISTCIDIYIKDTEITKEQVIQMTKDMADNFDNALPNVKQTLIFNPYNVKLSVKVMGIDPTIPIYSCVGHKEGIADMEAGTLDRFWIFTTYKNGKGSIIDKVYVETVNLNES